MQDGDDDVTALAVAPVTREGTGWSMEILPQSILLRLVPDDETAFGRALDDLASWSNPKNWGASAVGFDSLDHEIWVLLWEPVVTSW